MLVTTATHGSGGGSAKRGGFAVFANGQQPQWSRLPSRQRFNLQRHGTAQRLHRAFAARLAVESESGVRGDLAP